MEWKVKVNVCIYIYFFFPFFSFFLGKKLNLTETISHSHLKWQMGMGEVAGPWLAICNMFEMKNYGNAYKECKIKKNLYFKIKKLIFWLNKNKLFVDLNWK